MHESMYTCVCNFIHVISYVARLHTYILNMILYTFRVSLNIKQIPNAQKLNMTVEGTDDRRQTKKLKSLH